MGIVGIVNLERDRYVFRFYDVGDFLKLIALRNSACPITGTFQLRRAQRGPQLYFLYLSIGQMDR